MNNIEFYKETSLKETPIGKIPENWEVVRLKDVILEAKSGFASGKRDENGILQLRMDNIETEGWINPKAGVKVPIPPNVEEYILKPNDILFNNTNSADLIGKTAIFRGELPKCVYSNHLTRIRVNPEKVIPEWILYVLVRKWQIGIFKAICHRHVHQAGINNSDLLNLKIPLPPFPEQKAVAHILSTVDETIRKTNEIIEKTARLKKGLMQELLTKGIGHKEFKDTEIGRIPKEWEVVKLEDIAEDIYYGITAKAVEQRTNLRILRTTDIKDYHVDWNSLPFCKITEKRSKLNKYLLRRGDLIVARAGTTGVSVLVEKDFNDVIFGSYLIKIRLKESLLPKFIHYFFQSSFYWNHIISSQAGSTLKNLSLPILRSLRIPFPLLSEQKAIAHILSTIDKRLEVERNTKEKLERIKRSVMDLLLTGKIRVRT